ncbi:AroE Shikimate 5-dehydrogenase [Candidatus Nanopelagicaceae bacterium]
MITGAVLGSPISHSLSPVLHKAAFAFLGIEGDYSAIKVESGALAKFLQTRSSEFDYLSLTMPLKEEVLSLGLDADALTQRIQSGNTLIKRNDKWSISSTDGSGFVAALEHAGITEIDSVLILGAGGTARAVTGSLDSIAKNIHVLGRSSLRQEALESAISHSHFEYHRWSSDIDFTQYDLVVNTTPAGAADLLASSVNPGIKATLFDVIYKPWPTELAQRWSDCGGAVINGLELLMYQGVDQLALVLDSEFDREALATHLRAVLRKSAR